MAFVLLSVALLILVMISIALVILLCIAYVVACIVESGYHVQHTVPREKAPVGIRTPPPIQVPLTENQIFQKLEKEMEEFINSNGNEWTGRS